MTWRGVAASSSERSATPARRSPRMCSTAGGYAAIDWVKGHTVNNESVCDEGQEGYINPFHQWLPGPLKGPQVYLPGIHPNGDIIEW